MGNRMTPDEATAMAVAIREEWILLASLLEEAEATQAWVTAGFDRPGEWLDELPSMPTLTLHVGEVEDGPIAANQRQARVSRPGAKQIARPRAGGDR